MKKLFIKGFVFGIGFCCAVLLVGVVAKTIFFGSAPTEFPTLSNDSIEWHNLSKDEQLKSASGILVVRYKDGGDGSKIAYIDEVHGRNDDFKSRFSMSEKLPSENFYPKSGTTAQDAVVLLYVDSNNFPMASWFVYNDRVVTLGDMP